MACKLTNAQMPHLILICFIRVVCNRLILVQ